MDELLEQINLVVDSLPIETPSQLYLRKGDKYIDSYDPVRKIVINEHSIDIINDAYTYNHSFDEFDRIYIVPSGDEPVVLATQPLKGDDK